MTTSNASNAGGEATGFTKKEENIISNLSLVHRADNKICLVLRDPENPTKAIEVPSSDLTTAAIMAVASWYENFQDPKRAKDYQKDWVIIKDDNDTPIYQIIIKTLNDQKESERLSEIVAKRDAEFDKMLQNARESQNADQTEKKGFFNRIFSYFGMKNEDIKTSEQVNKDAKNDSKAYAKEYADQQKVDDLENEIKDRLKDEPNEKTNKKTNTKAKGKK